MKFLKISLEKCKFYFNFDENGNLYWKNVNRNRFVKNGEIAGYLNKSAGYFCVGIEGKNYYLHRILYQLYNNVELNDEVVDHLDNDPKNNKKENLRLCTQSENCMNRKVYKNNKSTGFKNISVYKSKNYEYFYIRIKKDGKTVYSKYFRTDLFTLEDVIKIRDEKLKEIHGEFFNIG